MCAHFDQIHSLFLSMISQVPNLLYLPTLVKEYTPKLKSFPWNLLTPPPISFHSIVFQCTVLVATHLHLPQSPTVMAAKATGNCDFDGDLPPENKGGEARQPQLTRLMCTAAEQATIDFRVAMVWCRSCLNLTHPASPTSLLVEIQFMMLKKVQGYSNPGIRSCTWLVSSRGWAWVEG